MKVHPFADQTPFATIEALIAEHGGWRILATTLRAALRRQKRPLDAGAVLNPHLRRDIGLPPQDMPCSFERYR